jgi:DNA-binding MarR family transcriptional regulator
MMKPSEKTVAAWGRLLLTHQELITRMDQELRDRHDLRLDWYDILLQLNRGGRMRMHELAAATLFSRTDCTRIVDRMERVGLVLREPATEDGRGVYAVLTTAGKVKLRRAAATHLEGIERLFGSNLNEAEVAAIESGLARVLAAL